MGQIFNKEQIIEITLINKTPDIIQMEGFVKNNNYKLKYQINKGVTIKEFLEHVNKFRVQRINQLHYNGHVYLDNETIDNDYTFYIRP